MMDAQSQAFRESGPEYWFETTVSEHPHSTLESLNLEAGYSAVDAYAGWDAERSSPKTLDEARDNLAARITDPYAPDTDETTGAYDKLDDGGT